MYKYTFSSKIIGNDFKLLNVKINSDLFLSPAYFGNLIDPPNCTCLPPPPPKELDPGYEPATP